MEADIAGLVETLDFAGNLGWAALLQSGQIADRQGTAELQDTADTVDR